MPTAIEYPRFAPVAPPHIMMQMLQDYEFRVFGAYHLWLAHLVQQFPKSHQAIVAEMAQRQHRGHLLHIIMDNSIVELGGSIGHEVMEEAVKTVTSSQTRVVPVLPDVMGQGNDTVVAIIDAYQTWCDHVPAPGGFMMVAQGDSFQDFCNTVNYFWLQNREKYRKITWIGIPRRLLATMGSRKNAIQYIQMVAPEAKLHLLGFSNNVWDDMLCARMPGIHGIDSAVPVRYPSHLTPTTLEYEIGPRPIDWLEKGVLVHQNVQNILNVRKWIGQRDI